MIIVVKLFFYYCVDFNPTEAETHKAFFLPESKVP